MEVIAGEELRSISFSCLQFQLSRCIGGLYDVNANFPGELPELRPLPTRLTAAWLPVFLA